MIVLTVQRYNGTACEPLAASFDELGGSIGRAATNHLVLPDPDRTVSRVHAEVVMRHGAHALVDRGSNPVLVNGEPLGNGQERLLRDGDEVQIGGYTLRASVGHAATSADPFADLFGTAATPAPAAAPPAPMSMPIARAAPGVAPSSRPAAAAGTPSIPPAVPPPSDRPPVAAPGGIPDDWDPFAPDRASLLAAPTQGTGNLLAPSPPAGWPVEAPSHETSIDDLFGLSGGSAPSGDPFGATPAARQPPANTADDADPLLALLGAAPAAPAPLPDHVSELNTPWPAPPLRAAGARPAPADSVPAPAALSPPSIPTPAALPPSPAGPVYSWEQPSRDRRFVVPSTVAPGPAAASAGVAAEGDEAVDAPHTIIVPKAAAAAAGMAMRPPVPTASAVGSMAAVAPAVPTSSEAWPPAAAFTASAPSAATTAAAPTPASAFAPPLAPAFAPTAATTTAPAPAPAPAPALAPASSMPATAPAPTRGSAPSDDTTLVAALFDGLGLPLPAGGADPAQLRRVGRLLREATRGTVELLLARAALKREMRADVTMIVARENNPLKFSPTVEVALQHLLGAPTPGFMPPEAAMRDAFNDLRAHQLGVMAGMRSALEGVIERFDPALLEGQLTRRTGLAALLPSSRKAQLWEAFQSLFAQLSREATDDFDRLFGKAFREAYENHIDRLCEQDDDDGLSASGGRSG